MLCPIQIFERKKSFVCSSTWNEEKCQNRHLPKKPIITCLVCIVSYYYFIDMRQKFRQTELIILPKTGHFKIAMVIIYGSGNRIILCTQLLHTQKKQKKPKKKPFKYFFNSRKKYTEFFSISR